MTFFNYNGTTTTEDLISFGDAHVNTFKKDEYTQSQTIVSAKHQKLRYDYTISDYTVSLRNPSYFWSLDASHLDFVVSLPGLIDSNTMLGSLANIINLNIALTPGKRFVL